MSRKMLVDAVHQEETRVVITDHKSSILEFDFTTAAKPQIKGNVYLAKVTRVEPSLQAAFVEYGGGKQGFLPFSEIHPNYYQIPVSDRQKLIEEEEAVAAQEAAEEEDDDDIEEIEELEADDDLSDDDSSDTIAAQTTDDESVQSEEIEATDKSAKEPKEKPKRTRRRKVKKDETEEISSDEAKEDTDKKEETEKQKPKRRTRKPSKKDETEKTENTEETSKEPSEEKSETETKDEDSKPKSRRRRRGGRNRNRSNRKRNNYSEDSNDVETISGDDEIEHPRRKRDYTRRYKIQEVIKRNQVLLVQVIKEERGNKGVSLSSFLSLAGRYCVLMPNSPRGGGVSRKISNRDDRKRIKKILNDMTLPQGMSVIIRTAGAGHTRAEIKRDFDYLVKMWNQIREETLVSSAPALVYEESNIIQRTIRDSYSNDIEEILVEGEETFKETKTFMRKFIPSHAPKVKLYKGDVPLFHKEGIDNQLLSMVEPEVRLRSGGSIVMVPTEALISIDVNSGRSTREKNIEETALKTNMEAAREVAKQLRLRDLAGLIVIDFIDMLDGKNRRSVERAMKEALRNDRAKIQVGRISSFGLLEMSRQRMRPSIAETMNRSCPHCQGTGFIRSEAALSIQIIRALEKEASLNEFDRFRVSVTTSEALYILNNMRDEIDKIENEFNCSIEITIDAILHEGNFRIEKFRRKGANNAPKPNAENKPKKQHNKRYDRRNKKEETSEETEEPVKEEIAEKPTEEEKPKKKRGRPAKKKPAKESKEGADKEPSPEVEAAKQEKEEAKDHAATKPANEDAPAKPKRSGWWQKIVD